jgi:hypothetical protein
MTILSRGSGPGGAAATDLVTVQCDVCCPPFISTNVVEQLHTVGWLTTLGGHPLEVCHVCRRRKPADVLVPRATHPTPPLTTRRALPNFVIIGAAKCATTSLHAQLDTHPEISMSLIKEPQYFNDPDCGTWLEFYRALFDADAAITGEASTVYTRYPVVPGVPERMAELVPSAKLLYMVRDPVDRAVSSYVEERMHSNDHRDPEVAFADLDDPYNPYVAASCYGMQLRRYLAVFPQEQVMVMDLADLEADPDAALVRICLFLGVDDTHEFDIRADRLNTRDDKREYPTMVRRLRGSPLLRVAYRLPPERREQLLMPMRRMLSRQISRPDLTDDLQARLSERLAPEAEDLRALTGEALSGWSI